MVEKRYPTRHTTIGSVIDAGLKIHGFCLDCGHNAKIELAEVARKLGRKHSSLPVFLVPKVDCDVCKSKNVGTYLADADAAVLPNIKNMSRMCGGLSQRNPIPEINEIVAAWCG